MNNQVKLDRYKQELAKIYSQRSQKYDESKWHSQITHRLVESAQIKLGDRVLDIATGTGHVAIEVAQLVGDDGRVVGIDISSGMLEQARKKIAQLNLTNIEFHLADGENIDFPTNSFDLIFCANAFPLMADKAATLRLWSQFLKPGGYIGLHSIAETGFTGIIVLEKVLENHGINLDFFHLSDTVNTIEKYQDLLTQADLEIISVEMENHGSYLSLEDTKKRWNLVYYPSPGNIPNPITQLSSEEIEQMKAEFEEELERLIKPEGIWNNGTTFLVLGRKAVPQ
ncbi:MAG: methyltransferase domain-containing protein [Okeania sp. SIO3B3]|nr:methyltransferase domain-containing protein [Okeania sp. SIO3B3]